MFGLTVISRVQTLDHILLVLVATFLPSVIGEKSGYAILGFSLVVLGLILIHFTTLTETWMTLAYTTGFVLFAFQVSLQKIKMEQMQRKLTHRNLELVQARDLLAQKTRNEERLRISRDLHDILGHQLTALNLNLETAFQKTQPENRNHLETCRKLAKELLRDVRGVVRSMRDETEFNFSTSLMAIGGQYPGVDLRFEGMDNLDITNPLLGECLLMCCQESVTNAIRHGEAERIVIKFHLDANELKVSISDNGRQKSGQDSGTGLQGMRERLLMFSGRLNASRQADCGWIVEIAVPRHHL